MSPLPDLVDRLSRIATERNLTIAVAESLTSGKVAAEVGRGSGAQDWFAGGVVAYQVRVKEELLGLTPGTDPCSARCAEQLARGVRRVLGADVAVTTTGVGGPDPQDGHEAGTVYLGWSQGDEEGHVLHHYDGEPAQILEQAVEAALTLLVEIATSR